jgi:hypothetical protein
MAAYGIFRATGFHPFFRPEYRAWLEQTPWTSRKPLPLGPIHLVRQDVVLLALVLLALHGTPFGRVQVLDAFLLAYLSALSISFWVTGPWWMAYIVLSILGLAVRSVLCPWFAFATLAVAYGIAMIGIRMALAQFPWPDSEILNELRRQFLVNSDARRKSLLGWPFGQLASVPDDVKIPPRDAILAPLLAAWWIYALISNISEGQERLAFPGVLFFYLTIVVLIVRLVTYLGRYRPPISLWGRIMTGRWIIPGYDYVLLGPFCTLLTALVGVIAVFRAGSAYCTITYPLVIAAFLIVALNCPPSLEKWRLTGHHRITPTSLNDRNTIRL